MSWRSTVERTYPVASVSCSLPTTSAVMTRCSSALMTSSELDSKLATITRLKTEGIAVLVVEQNVQSALAVADRVYVMDHGGIVHEGPARALLDDAAHRLRLLGV